MKDIKSAIESVIASSKQSLEQMKPLTRNMATKGTAREHLDRYSDFSVKLRCNSPELRSIFEDPNFDCDNTELVGDLGEVSKSIQERISQSLINSVSEIISENRVYFNNDPHEAVQEIKRFIDLVEQDIIQIVVDNVEYEKDAEMNRAIIRTCEELRNKKN